ncbi:MAG: HDOD domain-containing protein [Desulfobacterales bacterium]|nr:HDOD domain-containing protein [Desulfobacterales bacterium]
MDVYVARQPIFDRKKNIAAYELLFRDSMSNAFPDIDGDVATSKLLTRSFFNIGIDQLTGGKKAFINFTEDLLLKQVPTMFPAEEVVVEVLEDVTAADEVVRACEQITQKGYVLALDDFIYRDDLTKLIALADIIKIDFMLTPLDEIREMLLRLAEYDVEFLAEKIETYEEYQVSREMGFKYFQGYFFSKPEILKSTDIAPSHISLLQIVAELNREDCRMEKLEEMVNVDVSVSYKLLRYINSAYFQRVQEITSIRQALVLLGENGIRQFIMLVTAAELAGDKPNELIRASIIRAKFCELLGKTAGEGVDPAELFLVGLFSMLDAMLDASMDAIVEQLPFSESVQKALVDRKGVLADYLDLVTAYESGDWKACRELGCLITISEEVLPASYAAAVGWADAYPVL